MNLVRTMSLLALPFVMCTGQVSGATTGTFTASYVGTGATVAGTSIIRGEACSGEVAEREGVAGVPDEGGACFSAAGGRLGSGSLVLAPTADVSVTDVLDNPVGGSVHFATGSWTALGDVPFCGSIAGMAVPKGTRFIFVDLVADPGSGCGVATTGTIALTLH